VSRTSGLPRLVAVVVAICLSFLVPGNPAAASSRTASSRSAVCVSCDPRDAIAHTEAELTGWGFEAIVRLTGGNCRSEFGLRVCRTSLPLYGGDQGTTYGTTLVANPGLTLSAHLAKHEKVHRRQWAQAGWTFPYRYAIESVRHGVRCDNRFEQQAGLADGDYADC
jgi:hypothetical protein